MEAMQNVWKENNFRGNKFGSLDSEHKQILLKKAESFEAESFILIYKIRKISLILSDK